uniref:GTP-binding protein n=1 Tax=Panagrellus redivivus TaxID=6233 RepID=A0A7E4VBP4_PANRE
MNDGYITYGSMPSNSFLLRIESTIPELEKLVTSLRQMCFDGSAEVSILRKKLLAQSRMLSHKDQEIACLNAEVDLLLQAIHKKDYTIEWYASSLTHDEKFQIKKQFTTFSKLFDLLRKFFH